MNLREIKKLKVGDRFKRPSTNGHDTDGFRHYVITQVGSNPEYGQGSCLEMRDQHGYINGIAFYAPYAAQAKAWFKPAVMEGN